MKHLLLLLSFCLCALAQDQARIVGTITDPTGAVIPKASVTVTSEKTGAKRDVIADDKGYYFVTNLSPASYTIKAAGNNLGPTEIKEVALVAGQEHTLNIVLQPASVATEVTVSGGELTQVDTSSASIGANVNAREVGSLPLNGRQLSQLYLLTPGALTAGGGSFDNIRFSGRSNQQNIIRFDGVSGGGIIDNSPGNLNGESSSNFRLQSSLENIQEFRVESSNYPAEFGTGTGGQVSVVTKSGGNSIHGGIFEYVRNDLFDARNFFDGSAKSALRMNQFGGSVGGPIVKDKFFFFLSQETFFQRAGVAFAELVPSASAKAQAKTNALTIPRVNAILPLLNAYPAGQTSTTDPLLDFATASLKGSVDEYYGSLRFDYRHSDKDNFTLRYFRDQGSSFDPLSVTGRGQNFSLVPQNAMLSWSRIVTPQIVNEFKVGWNAAKSRSNGVTNVVAGIDLSPSLISISGIPTVQGIGGQGTSAGAASIGGLIRANSAFNTRAQPYTNWELPLIETLSWVKGNHNMKFGGEFRPIRINTDRFAGTTYTFTMAQLITNSPSQAQFNADAGLASPWESTGKTGARQARQEFYIAYAQDEWKLSPQLTMNYGLRYEYFSVMHERDNRNVKFNIVTGQIDPSDTPYYQASKTNFAPRLAFAYSPKRFNGNTVFRIGSGFFYGAGQPEDLIQPLESDRMSRTLTPSIIPGLAFPLDTAAIIAGYNINDPSLGFQPRAYSQGYKNPERVLSYTASIQHKLPGDTVVTVAFVGSQGRNLFLRSLANLITSVGTNPTSGAAVVTRQFGNRFAEIDYKTSGGNDHYNALQSTINRRFAKGLTFGFQHTWGRSIGESNGSNEAVTANNLTNFGTEYGNNSYDVRHNLNTTALWELPFGKNKMVKLTGPADYVFGGWEVGGIYNFRTGLPINVILTRNDTVFRDTRDGKIYSSPILVGGVPVTQAIINTPGGGSTRQFRRPDAVAGVSPFIEGADKKLYLNPAAFAMPLPGTYGNLSRNAIAGPSLSQLDMTLHKRIPVNERVNLEFRAEIYNLFNRANLANPQAVLSAGMQSAPGGSGIQPGQAFTAATAGGSFGRITSTVANTVGLGAQRQIQLSLRLNF